MKYEHYAQYILSVTYETENKRNIMDYCLFADKFFIASATGALGDLQIKPRTKKDDKFPVTTSNQIRVSISFYFNTFLYFTQTHIQNSAKHLRWSLL